MFASNIKGIIMFFRIVSDSSSNVKELPGADFKSVPLKIITSAAEYVDDENLDVEKMVNEVKSTKGKSGTSCPNVNEWLEAFEGADGVFAITITSRLSGSYASAVQAAEEYENNNPGAKVYVIDSTSTGGEMRLIMEFLQERISEGKTFEEIKEAVDKYMENTHLLFCLESLTNLARNGRVNPAVAKIAGVLGIRVVGAATNGVLDPLHKVRGEAKAVDAIYKEMKLRGFKGGKVAISHCFNPGAANLLKEKALADFPEAKVFIEPTGALCSFYAERGGLIIGFES